MAQIKNEISLAGCPLFKSAILPEGRRTGIPPNCPECEHFSYCIWPKIYDKALDIEGRVPRTGFNL